MNDSLNRGINSKDLIHERVYNALRLMLRRLTDHYTQVARDRACAVLQGTVLCIVSLHHASCTIDRVLELTMILEPNGFDEIYAHCVFCHDHACEEKILNLVLYH